MVILTILERQYIVSSLTFFFVAWCFCILPTTDIITVDAHGLTSRILLSLCGSRRARGFMLVHKLCVNIRHLKFYHCGTFFTVISSLWKTLLSCLTKEIWLKHEFELFLFLLLCCSFLLIKSVVNNKTEQLCQNNYPQIFKKEN